VIKVLGSLVEINDPIQKKTIRLQVRNIHLNVRGQRASIVLELYDPNQPIDQLNSGLIIPCKPLTDLEVLSRKELEEMENSNNVENEEKKNQSVTIPEIPKFPIGKPVLPDYDDINKWYEHIRHIHNSDTVVVETQLKGKINYLTGLPVEDKW